MNEDQSEILNKIKSENISKFESNLSKIECEAKSHEIFSEIEFKTNSNSHIENIDRSCPSDIESCYSSISNNVIKIDHVQSHDERENILKCKIDVVRDSDEKNGSKRKKKTFKNNHKDRSNEKPLEERISKNKSFKLKKKQITMQTKIIKSVNGLNKQKNYNSKKKEKKIDDLNIKKKKKSFCSCIKVETTKSTKKLNDEVEITQTREKEVKSTKDIKVEVPKERNKSKMVVSNREKIEQKTQLVEIIKKTKELGKTNLHNKVVNEIPVISKSLDNIYKIFEYDNNIEVPKFSEYMDLWFLSEKFASEREYLNDKKKSQVEANSNDNSLPEIISSTLQWYEVYKFKNITTLSRKLNNISMES